LSLLAVAKDESRSLTPKEVLSDSFIFYFAGHETTAHTLSFCLRMISLHPEVQQKIFEEVSTVLQPGQIPTYADFQKLIYTRCVFKETLRFYPQVPEIPKWTVEDTQLGSFTLPKGVR
jgi:cytochrome P450